MRKGFAAEQNPAAHHRDQSVHMAQPSDPRQHVIEARALRDQKHAVPRAPDYERPARPMPEAAQQEHDSQIHVGSRRTALVAAERNVQVIAKPVR